jgi:hypothetical protein
LKYQADTAIMLPHIFTKIGSDHVYSILTRHDKNR